MIREVRQMECLAPEVNATEEEMYHYWQHATRNKFPNHAELAESIIHDLLEQHDQENRRYASEVSADHTTDNRFVGLAHNLIAELLFNYERLDRELDDFFHQSCFAHLHLPIPDKE